MIELKSVSKVYDRFTAVSDLSLEVAPGEIFGFIGPNGAGKTTTIKMVAGVMAPTSGSVLIGGIDMLTSPTRAKRQIGFIPDRPYLYEKLTGYEFLKFTADLYNHQAPNFDGRAQDLLEMFSLSDWGHELIESYSHGMKQRLIMAAALIHEPQVIIVDEPMVGLDPAAIRMVKVLFRNLAQKGLSVFMSTHTLAVAEDVCDRVGIISKGRLVACGTIDELSHQTNLKSHMARLEQAFFEYTDAPQQTD